MDNCVADGVGRMLEKAGHGVMRLRDHMPPDTKDPIVAMACMASNRVLVTHDRDFKGISKRLALSNKGSRQLHRISLGCSAPTAAARLAGALDIIEFEWERIHATSTPEQLVIEISEAQVRLWR